MINQGKVEITDWIEGNSIESNFVYESTFLYSNTGKNYSLFQGNFIVGLEIELVKNFLLVLEGKPTYSFGGPSYFPITASVKFKI